MKKLATGVEPTTTPKTESRKSQLRRMNRNWLVPAALSTLLNGMYELKIQMRL